MTAHRAGKVTNKHTIQKTSLQSLSGSLKFLYESNNSNFFQTNPGFLVFATIAQALGKDPLHYWLDSIQGTRRKVSHPHSVSNIRNSGIASNSSYLCHVSRAVTETQHDVAKLCRYSVENLLE